MTRHQIWKARERARFREGAEKARMRRNYPHAVLLTDISEVDEAHVVDAMYAHFQARLQAAQRGIPEPFLG